MRLARMRWQRPDTLPDRKHWRTARWDGWEMVWNAMGAERCPRCAALVQTQVRYIHEDDHERVDLTFGYIRDALEALLDHAGIPYRNANDDPDDSDDGPLLPARDGGYIIGDSGLGAGEAQRL